MALSPSRHPDRSAKREAEGSLFLGASTKEIPRLRRPSGGSARDESFRSSRNLRHPLRGPRNAEIGSRHANANTASIITKVLFRIKNLGSARESQFRFRD